MNLTSFSERLKERREELGYTMEYIALKLNTTKATISRYESGIHEPKRTMIWDLAEVLGVSPSWLMGAEVDKYTEEKKETVCKKVPVLGVIRAGEPIYAVQNIEYYENSEDGSIDFCLRVKGDSMINARIHEGDIVYLTQQDDVENGEIAAVLVDGEDATLKRVYKMDGGIILHPENPMYKDMVFGKKDAKQIKILGKVKYFKAQVR